MKNLIVWVQTHKFLTVIGLVVLYVGWSIFGGLFGINVMRMAAPSISPSYQGYDSYEKAESVGMTAMGAPAMDYGMRTSSIMPPFGGNSTDLNAADRKVVTDTNFSLLVKDVAASIRQLKGDAETAGGFMVNSSINRPEEGGNGNLTVRVPSDRLDEYLEKVRGASVRVVSENVMGTDVTDQFTDVQARLETLNRTKQIYQDMLGRATDVDEILRVQQSIFNVQDQIDSLTGQLKYLENTSKSSLVTLYLSTDELSLPYAPGEPWRPQVVFKTAVRSLMMHVRGIANLAIWAVVYSPILLAGVVIVIIARRMMRSV